MKPQIRRFFNGRIVDTVFMPGKRAVLKRRTTLTLPADSLQQALKIAQARQVNLSTVISEVVSAGLRLESARHRRNQILENYRTAFSGFSEDELAILDGVILEPVGTGRR
jgi:hypothetical protein